MNKDGEIKILRGIETETGELNHIQMSTWGQVGRGWGGDEEVAQVILVTVFGQHTLKLNTV